MVFHLILIAIPVALLALFVLMVAYEQRANRRLILSGKRYEFDLKVERASFIVQHVDWGAFFNDLTRSGAERLLHDLAHTTLMLVRFIERELTGVVRNLRARREPEALPPSSEEESTRIGVAAAYLKKTVRRSRKKPVE